MNQLERTALIVLAVGFAFTTTLRCGPPGANAQSAGVSMTAESNQDQWRSGSAALNSTAPVAVVTGPLVLTHAGGQSTTFFALVASDAACKVAVREITLRPGDRAWLAANETLCAVGTGAFDYSGFVPYKP